MADATPNRGALVEHGPFTVTAVPPSALAGRRTAVTLQPDRFLFRPLEVPSRAAQSHDAPAQGTSELVALLDHASQFLNLCL